MPNLTPWAIYGLPTDNLLAALTPTVVAGTIDPAYPVANLVDGNPANPCKATSTGLTLQWDLGSALVPALPVIIHANLDGSASWQTNAAVDFSGAGDTLPVTLPVVDVDGYYDNPWVNGSTVTARRYLRLVITGNSTDIQIGQLWVSGTLYQLVHGHSTGSQRVDAHPMLAQETIANVEMTYDYGVRELSLAALTVITSRNVGFPPIQTWWRSSGGGSKPFPIVIDPTVNAALFVRFDLAKNKPSIVAKVIAPNTVSVGLAFREVGRGLPY